MRELTDPQAGQATFPGMSLVAAMLIKDSQVGESLGDPEAGLGAFLIETQLGTVGHCRADSKRGLGAACRHLRGFKQGEGVCSVSLVRRLSHDSWRGDGGGGAGGEGQAIAPVGDSCPNPDFTANLWQFLAEGWFRPRYFSRPGERRGHGAEEDPALLELTS